MTRRRVLQLYGFATLAGSCLAAVQDLSIRGKLTRSRDGKPALYLDSRKQVGLHGDDDTNGVLNDQRILNSDFEAVGHYSVPDQFEVDGIHTRAMFVHKDGKRLMVTYWCDVCYIRTYTPGTCVCCQAYTDLDLRETDDEAH